MKLTLKELRGLIRECVQEYFIKEEEDAGADCEEIKEDASAGFGDPEKAGSDQKFPTVSEAIRKMVREAVKEAKQPAKK